MKRCILPLLALITGLAAAQAAAPSPISVTLSQALVRGASEKGQSGEQLTPNPKQIVPGAILLQTVTAKNMTTKPVMDVILKLPVPKNTQYLALQGVLPSGVRAEFSLDGKTFGSAPLFKQVAVTENGKSVIKQVQALPSEYAAVRWTVGTLAPGAEQSLSIRVQVK